MTPYRVRVFVDSLLQIQVADWIRLAPNVQTLIQTTRPAAEREFGQVVFLRIDPLTDKQTEAMERGEQIA